MGSKQTEAALEDLCRTRSPLARQHGSGNPTLRRPTRMQKLGLCPIHPALQQAGCKASADPRRMCHAVRIESQQFRCKISNAERCEQSRRMKAALVKLPGRHTADTARDLVAQRDSRDQIAP